MFLFQNYLKNVFLVLLFFMVSCQQNPVDSGDDATDINEYIIGLNYQPDELTNIQETDGQSSKRTALSADTTYSTNSTSAVTCVKVKYNLQQNFDDIAILRPLAGIVWPGALVLGNQSLMDGLPQPISLARAPLTLTVNLPGIGTAGVQEITDPSNSSVQSAIDASLEWWNANAYQEGYINASSSSYRLSTSYSSQQLALDVGLNVAWATSDVSSQFSYTSTENKKVMMAVYKQAFYSVDMDTPQDPSAVFADNISLDNVKSAINNDAPPAYISSVVYGRIIMFRMETSMKVSSAELEASFRYAAGYSVEGSLESRYKSILQSSTIEVVTIGGNAEVASQAVSARNAGDLETIIKGENAVYSRSNPGVPIAYTVLYLKDNSLVKLGYTTEYTATECTEQKTADIVDIKINHVKIIRDCDTIGKGDFDIWVNISAGNKTFSKKGFKGGKGDQISLGWDHSFVANLVEGNHITVTFTCTEKDLGGADSRMNAKSGSIRHEYRSGRWTNLNNNSPTITLNEGSACSTQLNYSISFR